MRQIRERAGAAMALALIASACGGATVTPTAPASALATTAATATPTPAAVNLYLRSWTVHPSIGPVNSLGYVPLVISNGQLLSVTYATASPFPLYTAPERRSVSQAGLAMILAEAQHDGLLGTA